MKEERWAKLWPLMNRASHATQGSSVSNRQLHPESITDELLRYAEIHQKQSNYVQLYLNKLEYHQQMNLFPKVNH